jgi:hypothetical protein
LIHRVQGKAQGFLRAFSDAIEVVFLALEPDAFIVDRRFYFVMTLGPFVYPVRAGFGAGTAVDTGV